MPSRSRPVRALVVVLGLLLLADALFVNTLAVGAPSHTYERVNVSVADGDDRLVFENQPRADFGGLDGLDCYEWPASRLCLLEAARLNGSDGPNVTVRRPVGRGDPAAPFAYHDGTFYRRTRDRPEGVGGPVRVTFSPREAETVLSTLAVPPNDVSATTRRALRTGSVTTREPIDSPGTLVRTDGGYATVGETLDTGPDRPLRAVWRGLVGLVGFVLVAFGVGSLRRD